MFLLLLISHYITPKLHILLLFFFYIFKKVKNNDVCMMYVLKKIKMYSDFEHTCILYRFEKHVLYTFRTFPRLE